MKTNQRMITGTIDVSKINKERLYKGKKGTYLNITIFINDELDKYNNNGFIAESISKEEKQSGTLGNILGNVKYVVKQTESQVEKQDEWESDLPF